MSFIVFIFDIFRHMPSAMNNSFHDEIRYHDPISVVVMVPEKDVVYYNIYWDITMCNFTIIDIEISNFKTADLRLPRLYQILQIVKNLHSVKYGEIKNR